MLAERLKKGNIIGIVAPSNTILAEHKKYIINMENYLKKIGLRTIVGKNLFKTDKYGISAGTPEQRAEDLNSMFLNPKVRAVWCFQGGNTANQVLPLLDFKAIKKNPKLFLGKSDIDLLTLAIYKKVGLTGFHCPDPKIGRKVDMDNEYSQHSFKERLMQGKIGNIKPTKNWKEIRAGRAKGKILGCNINAILKLAGTEYMPSFRKSILFLESYTTGIKTTQYRLEQLKQLGIFDKIKGIVIGHIYGFENKIQRDKDGGRVHFNDLVLEATKDYDFPIMKIEEFGHYCPNCFLPIGANAEIDTENLSIEIKDKCVKSP